jgi:hypothetical protein
MERGKTLRKTVFRADIRGEQKMPGAGGSAHFTVVLFAPVPGIYHKGESKLPPHTLKEGDMTVEPGNNLEGVAARADKITVEKMLGHIVIWLFL